MHADPVGLLTNEPPYEMQTFRLNDYLALTPDPPENRFCPALHLAPYSLGMGAIGLPGDASSPSRYVRAAFLKLNSLCPDGEAESVAGVFHILESVAQIKGCTRLPNSEYEFTQYSACINATRGLYYCKTYDGLGLTCVDLHREDLEGQALSRYPLMPNWEVLFRN